MAEFVSHRVAIGRYFSIVWEDGIARMGAGLGVAFTFGAAYFGFIAQHNIAALWLLALLSFLFAGYRVWLKEHHKFLETQARPVLIGLFQGKAELEPYPYENDGTGSLIVKKRLGTIVETKVRIVATNSIPTTIHDLSLGIEIEGKRYVAEHPEADEYYMYFDDDHRLRQELRHPDTLLPLLGKRKVELGQPLEGRVRFKVPGLYADGVPDSDHKVRLTLAVEDERGEWHVVIDPEGSQRLLQD
jgi:hypothetical protein